MGETFDTDYGRTNGMLGLEAPGGVPGMMNFIVYGYAPRRLT